MTPPVNTFEKRRRALLVQMLPHSCLGHPLAQVCLFFGRQDLANRIHYHTLPRRTKRRIKSVPNFSPDKRLRSMDLVFTPVCSIARSLGLYRTADWIFRLGPHEIATELGACGFYYQRPDQNIKQRDLKAEELWINWSKHDLKPTKSEGLTFEESE
jgi:hypothetical protein